MKRLTLWLLALVLIAGAFNKLPEGFESVAPPEAEPIHGEVIVDALNLRDAPSLDGERIGGLTLGQRVELVAWNVGRDDAYLWVEVETEAGRGFAAAYRREDWDYEREVEITREDYLAWEHDFGEYELTASFDLDRDGTEDVVRVGPDMEGLNGSQYPNAVGEMVYSYALPLVVTVEGSLETSFELTVIELGPYYEPISRRNPPDEPAPASGSWSFYELVFEDFDKDGIRELGLNYGFDKGNSDFSPLYPDLRRWTWFRVADGKLRVLASWVEYLCEPQDGADDGGWKSGAWSVRGEMRALGGVLTYTSRLSAYLTRHSADIVEPMRATRDLGPWNCVGHTLFPPNYLSAGESWTFELELEYIQEFDSYALVCPSGNEYANRLFYSPTIENLGALVDYPLLMEDEDWISRATGSLPTPPRRLPLPSEGPGPLIPAETFIRYQPHSDPTDRFVLAEYDGGLYWIETPESD